MHFQLGLVQGRVSFWAWADALLGFSPCSHLLSVLCYNLTWFQDQVRRVTLVRAKNIIPSYLLIN